MHLLQIHLHISIKECLAFISNAVHGWLVTSDTDLHEMTTVWIERYELVCWCVEGDRKDSCRATVQWYWWMIELPRSAQKKAASRYEVFLSQKNYGNEIDLETILKTHEVFTLLNW